MSDLPHYDAKGWMLVEVFFEGGKIGINDYAYDDNSSVFWIQEELGLEYWLQSHRPDEIISEGWWVIEGIHATVVKYDYSGDVDVDWDFDKVRPATEKEIKMEMIDAEPE